MRNLSLQKEMTLARELSLISPYASQIQQLAIHVPKVMEENDQLRPLWQSWCRGEKHFEKNEIKILLSFFEYLYFASDAFLQAQRKIW